MRKPDEISFYAALRSRAATSDTRRYYGPYSEVIAISRGLGIHDKRAFCLLSKWCSKGYVDCGMWLWAGWFTDGAPEALTP